MGQYTSRGAGLANPANRKKLYTLLIVLGAVVIAVLVTLGIISLNQVEEFISLTAAAVGLLGGASAIIAGALARNNVEPPEIDATPVPDDYQPKH